MRTSPRPIKRTTITPPIDLRGVCTDYIVKDPGQNPKQIIRPLIGGVQLSSQNLTGTLGLVIYPNPWPSQALGILTAGHVCGTEHTNVWQPVVGNIVGTVLVNGFRNGSNIDVALTTIGAGIPAVVGEIFSYFVNYQVNELEDWPNDQEEVTMQGAQSGVLTGHVVHQNAIITWNNQQLNNVSIVDYIALPGDSGSPVVNIDGNTITFLGIQGGNVVISGVVRGWFTPLATIETIITVNV